jgi:hypothetical protein
MVTDNCVNIRNGCYKKIYLCDQRTLHLLTLFLVGVCVCVCVCVCLFVCVFFTCAGATDLTAGRYHPLCFNNAQVASDPGYGICMIEEAVTQVVYKRKH